MEMRKGEQPLVMMMKGMKTRVIVVVTTIAVIVDMMMMIAALVVTIIAEVRIARIVVMIGMNPIVIEKMKMQTYSMRNITVMWTIMMKT